MLFKMMLFEIDLQCDETHYNAKNKNNNKKDNDNKDNDKKDNVNITIITKTSRGLYSSFDGEKPPYRKLPF